LQAIFDRMQQEAQRLGADIVAGERALSEGFAGRALSAADLEARVDSLGALYAQLRATHLRAHLETTALLRPEQVRRYDRFRGYGDGTESHADSHAHPGT
jgi:hypothetical protein